MWQRTSTVRLNVWTPQSSSLKYHADKGKGVVCRLLTKVGEGPGLSFRRKRADGTWERFSMPVPSGMNTRSFIYQGLTDKFEPYTYT